MNVPYGFKVTDRPHEFPRYLIDRIATHPEDTTRAALEFFAYAQTLDALDLILAGLHRATCCPFHNSGGDKQQSCGGDLFTPRTDGFCCDQSRQIGKIVKSLCGDKCASCGSPLAATAQEWIQLGNHVLAMGDDAYLVGHPEWLEIVKETAYLMPAAACTCPPASQSAPGAPAIPAANCPYCKALAL